MRLFGGIIGADFIFIDDKAWSDRNLVVEELLENKDITRIYWLAHSPDLNLPEQGGCFGVGI